MNTVCCCSAGEKKVSSFLCLLASLWQRVQPGFTALGKHYHVEKNIQHSSSCIVCPDGWDSQLMQTRTSLMGLGDKHPHYQKHTHTHTPNENEKSYLSQSRALRESKWIALWNENCQMAAKISWSVLFCFVVFYCGEKKHSHHRGGFSKTVQTKIRWFKITTQRTIMRIISIRLQISHVYLIPTWGVIIIHFHFICLFI